MPHVFFVSTHYHNCYFFCLFQSIVLITTYVAILIQFQIAEENVPAHLKWTVLI